MLMTAQFSQVQNQSLSRQASIALWGAFLLFLCTQISIPLQPVAITLQTFAVMLIGLTFERKAALNAVIVYLTVGALGLPVFSNFSGGFHHFIGPTGGYLFGFAVAVMLMGAFRTFFSRDNFALNVVNCLLGTTVIYIFGISWLTRFIGFDMAVKGGLYPFVIPGVIKAVLLCLALRYLKTGRFSFNTLPR